MEGQAITAEQFIAQNGGKIVGTTPIQNEASSPQFRNEAGTMPAQGSPLNPMTAPVQPATQPVSQGEEEWEEVGSDLGRTIRWREVAQSQKEAEKTFYAGAEIHGLYVGRRDNVGENDASIYQLDSVEFGLLNIWDTTVLRDKMKNIYEGNEVKIKCLGEQKPKTGGKAYFNFSVFQRPPSTDFLRLLDASKKERQSNEINIPESAFN